MSFGVVPYLLSPDVDKHVEWMKNVLGGEIKETYRTNDDAKHVMHCSVAVNGGHVFIADRRCNFKNETDMPSEEAEGEPKGFFCQLELEDPKQIWDKAMKNDSMVVVDLKVQFWGDLYGVFRDPFGFPWSVIKVEGDKRKPGVIAYLLSPAGKCDAHMEWLTDVCGAEQKSIYRSDDGKVMHSEMALNGGAVCLADSGLKLDEQEGLTGTPRHFHCHMCITNPQTTWDKALKKDAKSVMDLKMQFWGDVYGMYKDPFGFVWSVAEPSATDDKDKKSGVIPCILSSDCKKHIEWVKNVFDGKVKQIFYTDATEEKVMHCCITVNKGYLYLSDNICNAEQNSSASSPAGQQGIICHLNVPDPEMVWKKAMGNGASPIMQLKVQSWGDLYGSFRDPLGYEWALRKED